MNVLDIYVAKHCFGYKEALRLAGEVREALSGLRVRVTLLDEITEEDMPDIPATPSYSLNGSLLFLGNPPLEELMDKIASFDRDKRGSHG